MKKYFYTLLVSVGFFQVAFGQYTDTIQKPLGLSRKNIVSVNLGQLLLIEPQITYERRLNKIFSLAYTLGFKPRIANSSQNNRNNGSLFGQEAKAALLFIDYNLYGTYNAIQAKIFFDKPDKVTDTYVSLMLFHRYYWGTYSTPSKYAGLGFSSQYNMPNIIDDVKMDANIFGVKLLMGHNFRPLKISNDKALVFDLYYGIGFRGKTLSEKYTIIDNNTILAVDDLFRTTIPSIHVGVKLGFAWN